MVLYPTEALPPPPRPMIFLQLLVQLAFQESRGTLIRIRSLLNSSPPKHDPEVWNTAQSHQEKKIQQLFLSESCKHTLESHRALEYCHGFQGGLLIALQQRPQWMNHQLKGNNKCVAKKIFLYALQPQHNTFLKLTVSEAEWKAEYRKLTCHCTLLFGFLSRTGQIILSK